MLRVRETLQAEAQIGLIQKENAHHPQRLAEIQAAYYRLLMELRLGKRYIFYLASERYRETYELNDPPLRVHFRHVGGEIFVVDYEEIQPEISP